MNKIKRITALADVVLILVGTAVYSAAVTVFLEPAGISPGGVTGIATAMGELSGLPVGLLVLVLNIPLLIWGYIKLGGSFMLKTVISTVLLSVWIDLFAVLLTPYGGDRLLAALYGGFLSGAGLAMVFLRGGSTGGTDIAAKIISMRFARFSIGILVLLLDAFVILLAAVVYRSFETALYTTLTIFISTRVIDSIVYGADRGKLAFIVTEKPEAVTDSLYSALHRGVTLVPARGGYSKDSRTVLLCAVRVHETARLRRAVKESDGRAFLILTEAGEISGEGFVAH